jgi:hypothetical protein
MGAIEPHHLSAYFASQADGRDASLARLGTASSMLAFGPVGDVLERKALKYDNGLLDVLLFRLQFRENLVHIRSHRTGARR